MTDSLFKITSTPPPSIKLEPGREGKLSFTVESLAAPDKVHEVIAQALLVGDGGKGKEADWLEVSPNAAFGMTGGETRTITITARPTPTTPRGEHKIKLVIADTDRPNDVYADSSTVLCEVLAPAGSGRPPPRKIPWWLIAIIAGGVLVIAGAVVLIVKLAGGGSSGPPGLGDACSADAAKPCDEGLACAGGKCLLIGGATCEPAQASQCASGECEQKTEVCTIPLGGTCDPTDQDVTPCLTSSTCDPATKRCLGNVGAPCKADAECATGNCAGNVCAIKKPAVNAGDPCAGTCPEPLHCSATTKRCVEQLGRPCSNHNQCATGLCEQNVCTQPELLRDCTRDGICGLDQKCSEVQPGLKRCVWQPGHACSSGAQCSSKWCNQGVCTRDDGKCDGQSDCPSPYLCIAAKKRCLLPNGALCGGDAECDSGFCRNNRCAPSPCVPPCGAKFRCNNNPLQPRCLPRFPTHFERLKVPWKVLPGVQ